MNGKSSWLKGLTATALVLTCSAVLMTGCSKGTAEKPQTQNKVSAEETAKSMTPPKQETKVENSAVKAKEETSAAEKVLQVEKNGGEIEQKEQKPESAGEKTDEPVETVAGAVSVPCILGGKSYTDITSDMSVLDVLKRVVGRIPGVKKFAESSNSKYYCKEKGKLLVDQGCEVLWEFELREAGGYDPDKYYLVRIKESGGRITAVKGSLGWDEPFPSAVPNAEAAGIVQEKAPYDLLGLR